jgi:maleate isomerase
MPPTASPSPTETPEYGPVHGVLAPMANTTAEPEMAALLAGSTMLTARLVSRARDSRQRLLDYVDGIDAAIDSFDEAPLVGAGFACTCYYLHDPTRDEADRLRREDRLGIAVPTSTSALRDCFAHWGVDRIAWVTPYPSWLAAEGERWWRHHGVAITARVGLPTDLLDTRGIYRLTTARVEEMWNRLDASGADLVLFGGTGMPTLPFMARREPPIRVLSSNIALAAALLARGRPIGPALDYLTGPAAPWRARYATP